MRSHRCQRQCVACRHVSGWVPVAFVLSTFVGIIGSVVQDANALFVWSGVIFGIAFAGLGFEMWTSSSILGT